MILLGRAISTLNFNHMGVQRARSKSCQKHISSHINSEPCLDATNGSFVEVAVEALELERLERAEELCDAIDSTIRCVEFVADELRDSLSLYR